MIRYRVLQFGRLIYSSKQILYRNQTLVMPFSTSKNHQQSWNNNTERYLRTLNDYAVTLDKTFSFLSKTSMTTKVFEQFMYLNEWSFAASSWGSLRQPACRSAWQPNCLSIMSVSLWIGQRDFLMLSSYNNHKICSALTNNH